MADKESPLGEQDVHPVTESLGSRPDEDIVKGPPAGDAARFVKVGSADDPFEADLLADALDEAQIPVVARSSRDMFMDPLVVPAPNFWDIFVPAEYEERARGIVEARKAAIEAGAGDAERAAVEEEAASEPPVP